MDDGTRIYTPTVSALGNETINGTVPYNMMSMDYDWDRGAYFGYELTYFQFIYKAIHGYLSLAVCIFGIIANILNIIVLTRKDMISATNALLTGIAVTDMFVISSYVPYAIHTFIQDDTDDDFNSYGWAIFTLFYSHFTVVCHTISIWLTVVLAILRYLAVSSPTNSKTWCSMKMARWAIILTYIIVPAFCLPQFFTFTISKFKRPDCVNCTGVLYKVDFSEIAKQNDELLKKVNFWIFSILTKLVPCILLTYLSLALIRVLVEANRRKQRLQSNNIPLKNSSVPNPSLKRDAERQRITTQQQSDRTTKMLIAVLITFLICEFPSGILALLSGICGKTFFMNVYHKFGDLMDMLALINSAVNFILYCLMSQQFRNTFSKLFCPKINDTRRHSYTLAQNAIEPTCETECV